MITDAWVELSINGHKVLLCLVCKKYSYHPQDIQSRFCGGCGVFLQTIPRTEPGPAPGQSARAWVQERIAANWQRQVQRYREEQIVSPLFMGKHDETD